MQQFFYILALVISLGVNYPVMTAEASTFPSQEEEAQSEQSSSLKAGYSALSGPVASSHETELTLDQRVQDIRKERNITARMMDTLLIALDAAKAAAASGAVDTEALDRVHWAYETLDAQLQLTVYMTNRALAEALHDSITSCPPEDVDCEARITFSNLSDDQQRIIFDLRYLQQLKETIDELDKNHGQGD